MRLGLLLSLALALSRAGSSQELVWEKVGVKYSSHLGGQTVVLGDINADGYEDLLHIPYAMVKRPGNFPYPDNQFWTLSGKDGQTLRVRLKLDPARAIYGLTAAGDMNGDGIGDYAVSLWDQSGRDRNTPVEVRSGKDEALLWKVEGSWKSLFGWTILGNLDLDGDKKPDLVVAAARGTPYGQVLAYSNKGSLLYKVNGTLQLQLGVFAGSESLGRVGDLDRDGADDFVVGGIDGPSGGKGAGVVLSGKTGKVLVKGLDTGPGQGIGYSVDGCGDMDGDGVPDFVAGSGFGRGAVHAFSGKTGKAIHSWTAKTIGLGFDGDSVKSGGIDVDRDGIPDVIVGSPYFGIPSQGAAFVFSGRDGSAIFVLRPTERGQTYLGQYVQAIAPQPGSPFPLFAVCEPGYKSYTGGTLTYQGRLLIYRGSPAGVTPYGFACKGTLGKVPRLGVRDLRAIGTKGLRLHISSAAPGLPAVLLLGRSRTSFLGAPLPLDVSAFGFPGCSLYTSIDFVFPTFTGTTGIAKGYGFVDLPFVPNPKGATVVHAQWLSLGPGPVLHGALTDALQGRF